MGHGMQGHMVVPRGPTLPLASQGGGTDPSPRGHMSSLGDIPGARAFLNSVWGGGGGGSWGRERSAHRISGRPEVVWGFDRGFRKKLPAKVWRLSAELPIEMAVDVVLRLG